MVFEAPKHQFWPQSTPDTIEWKRKTKLQTKYLTSIKCYKIEMQHFRIKLQCYQNTNIAIHQLKNIFSHFQ